MANEDELTKLKPESSSSGSFAVEVAAPWPPYEYHKRPRRDTWAAILYVTLVSVAAIGSLIAFIQTDRNAMEYGQHFYENSTSCSFANYSASAPPKERAAKTYGIMFAISIAFWVPVSLGSGVLLSMLYLYLFRQHTLRMVVASGAVSVTALVCVGIFILVQGVNLVLGVLVLVVAVAVAGIFWWWREDFILCSELLAITCKGLKECPGIVRYNILILVVGLVILAYLFAGFMFGIFIGRIVRNPLRASDSAPQGDLGICFSEDGEMVDCCTFKTAGWALAHVCITGMALLWTFPTLLQLQLYVVSDAMAQWYYQPTPCHDAQLRASVPRALRNGLTSSFGSICIAGAILMLVTAVNNVANRVQQSVQGCLSYVALCASCCVQIITSVIPQFTLFSVVTAAVFGLGFCGSSMKIYKTLKRNLLTVFNFWGVPNLILLVIVIVATLAWAGFVLGFVYIRWTLLDGVSGRQALKVAATVGTISAVCVGGILYFVTSIMLDAVNAVFVLYLLDLDNKSETHPELHEMCERTPLLAKAAAERSGSSGLKLADERPADSVALLSGGPGERPAATTALRDGTPDGFEGKRGIP